MNKLLPEKKDLKPIENDTQTFFECGFNKEFDNLTFKKQLEIINDIVRQSILTNTFPNPDNEIYNLEGNCHTAARVLIDYLKYLKIGKNYRYVMGLQRKFDPSDITTKHALVLVDDENGETYQVDPAPFVGYKYGYVSNIKEDKFYNEYFEIKDDLLYLLDEMRRFIYSSSVNKITVDEFKKIHFILEESKKYYILNGYTSYCYNVLAKLSDNITDRNKYIFEANRINNYDKSQNLNNEYKNDLKMKQIELWKEELSELVKSNSNLKKQLELSQNIIQELKLIDNSLERWFNINGESYRVSNLTPRFFMENKLNLIMIKASAYRLGVRATIRERFLHKGNGVVDEYFINLTEGKNITNIKPMLFSHPMGDSYERSMNGTANIILLNEPVDKLYKIKKILRSELGKNIVNKNVMWYDNEYIEWHPFVTNLVHSTDNPSESCLHYSIGFPEHQLMTRFMYPNPILEEEEKKLWKK